MSSDPPEISSVAVDAVPSAPPPAVLEAISAAAGAYDRLAANGVRLHFHLDDAAGRVTVQVFDLQGSVVGNLRPSQALDLATDGALTR